jgi:glucose-1-phosphate thymidylyltransferase
MKAIILAGGFAKRMWPLTKDKPKHLLPIADEPMLNHVLEKLKNLSELDRIYVSTNAKFEEQFNKYLSSISYEQRIELFIEDTKSEQEKLGSVGALGLLIREKEIDDDLIVIGGDNLFDFKMKDFEEFFKNKQGNIVALYDIRSIKSATLYGVVSIDNHQRVIDFAEKPEKPKSSLVSTACYLFTQKGVKNILHYLSEGNDPDKMGHFIEWLYKNDDVFGFIFDGYWFDIGSFESYDEANEFFQTRN